MTIKISTAKARLPAILSMSAFLIASVISTGASARPLTVSLKGQNVPVWTTSGECAAKYGASKCDDYFSKPCANSYGKAL